MPQKMTIDETIRCTSRFSSNIYIPSIVAHTVPISRNGAMYMSEDLFCRRQNNP